MPVLLVIVAALGVYRSNSVHQPSWQGASFGMFASYDSRASRTIAIRALGAGGEQHHIRLPRQLATEAERLKVVPTESAATRLASTMFHLLGEDIRGIEVVVRRIVIVGDDRLLLRIEPITRGLARR